MYRDGNGVAQDYVKAREYYQKAMGMGDETDERRAKEALEWLGYAKKSVSSCKRSVTICKRSKIR
ncbi:SEL1-like repeat protein [Helicobacter salomonis]|uniref:SEL1-like repeat protein n=1 Tax=Helicobacter salomonis TaxID=56878 RepID=UPI00131567BA|nr:SEL1-like repeat protein [Helicobacter salomonis]